MHKFSIGAMKLSALPVLRDPQVGAQRTAGNAFAGSRVSCTRDQHCGALNFTVSQLGQRSVGLGERKSMDLSP